MRVIFFPHSAEYLVLFPRQFVVFGFGLLIVALQDCSNHHVEQEKVGQEEENDHHCHCEVDTAADWLLELQKVL